MAVKQVLARAARALFKTVDTAVGEPRASVHTVQLLLSSDTSKSVRPLTGRVGATLLQVARENNVNIDGTCDGNLNCSTCHCVLGDRDVFNEASAPCSTEKDLLDSAWGVERTSRLACRVKVTLAMDNMMLRFPGPSVDLLRLPILENDTGEKMNDRGIRGEPQYRKESIEPTALTKSETSFRQKKFQNITKSDIKFILKRKAPHLLGDWRRYRAVAEILPFRSNSYIIDEAIRWDNVPNDPIFQLTFPQLGMLPQDVVDHVTSLIADKTPRGEIREYANSIRKKLNPHPAKQMELNVPMDTESDLMTNGARFIDGMQHKYRETVLFFPSESQYCHAFCTYCFRWAQFVGNEDLQFASNDAEKLVKYLHSQPDVTDLLLTGGDPMVLNSKQLGRYLDAAATVPHLNTIRIGSKSLSYWPYKYVTDDDADDMLRLLERTVNSGKHVSLMAHISHPQELENDVVREAIRRLRSTGIQIRTQAPLIKHVNDDAEVWASMWQEQVKLGLVPYYMFVERDTGPRDYFGVSLVRALDIYNKAIAATSGLARTARGPSMSATPGKVHIIGDAHIAGERVLVLKFLQGRNPDWVAKPFLAKYSETARWLDDLEPAFGEKGFFWEEELAAMEGCGASSGQLFPRDA